MPVTRWGHLVVAMVGPLTLAASVALAQGPPPKPPEERPREVGAREDREREDRPRMIDPATLRERLERRREIAKRMLQRLDEASARLERGEDPTEIERELEPMLRGFGPGGARLGERLGGDRAAGDGLAGNRPPGDRPAGERSPGADRPGAGVARDDIRRPDGARKDGPNRSGRGGPDGPAGKGGGGGPGAERPMADLAGEFGLGPARQLSAEERMEIRGLLDREHPELATLVDLIAGKSELLADRAIDGLGARLRDMRDLREKDRPLFDLRVEEVRGALELMRAARVFADASRAGKPDEIQAGESDLRERMSKQFDQRAKIQQHQIDQLDKRVTRMRRDLDGVRTKREQVIDEKVTALKRGATKFLDEMNKRKGGPKGSPPEGRKPGGP